MEKMVVRCMELNKEGVGSFGQPGSKKAEKGGRRQSSTKGSLQPMGEKYDWRGGLLWSTS